MFFFKRETAYEIRLGLVGWEMCIGDSPNALDWRVVSVVVGVGVVVCVVVVGLLVWKRTRQGSLKNIRLQI